MRKIFLLIIFVIFISYVYAQEEPPEDILLYPDIYMPRVVSSYDLETPGAIGQGSLYPVYITLKGIKTNPALEIPRIESISVSLDQRGSKYANAPRHLAPKNRLYTLDNMGYLILYLRKDVIVKEPNIPESIDLDLKATIYYRVNTGFGVFPQDLVLNEISEQEFQNQKQSYNFWTNRGYLRLNKLENGIATISVYDAAGNKITTLEPLTTGQTSRQFNLRRLFFESEQELKYRDRARVKFNGITSGEKAANIQIYINNRLKFINRFEGQRLYPGSAWHIKSIISVQDQNEITLENKETNEVIKLYKNRKGAYDCKQITTEEDCKLISQCAWTGTLCVNKEQQAIEEKTSVVNTQSQTNEKQTEIINQEWESLKSKHSLLQKKIERLSDEELKNSASDITKEIQSLESSYFEFMSKYPDSIWISLARLRLTNSFPSYTSVWSLYDKLEKATGDKVTYSKLKDNLLTKDKNFHDKINVPLSIENKEKDSNGYFNDGIASYENVANSYTESQSIDDKSELGPLALKRIAEIYQNNLNNFEKAAETYKRLLNEFPSTDYVKSNKEIIERWIELLEDRKNYNINSEHIVEGENVIDLTLDSIVDTGEPSKAFIDVNGIQKEYKVGETIVNNWYVDEINTDNVRVIRRTEQRDITQTLRLNQITTLDNNRVTLLRTETKSKILVTVLPGEERTFSVTKFSVHIPIEKRFFKLTPEQIEREIIATNNAINNLENVINNVGKLWNLYTGYCVLTFSYLYVKNFFTDKFTVKARKEVINKWEKYCDDKKNSGAYSSINRCLIENNEEIESEVDSIKQIIKDVEEDSNIKLYQKEAEIKRRTSEYIKLKSDVPIKEYVNDYLNVNLNFQTNRAENEIEELSKKVFLVDDKGNEKIVSGFNIENFASNLKEKDQYLINKYKNAQSDVERRDLLKEILAKERTRIIRDFHNEFDNSKNTYLKQFESNLEAQKTVQDFYKNRAPQKVTGDSGQELILYSTIITDEEGYKLQYENDKSRYLLNEDGSKIKVVEPEREYYIETVDGSVKQKVVVTENIPVLLYQPKLSISEEPGSKGRLKAISIDAKHYVEVTKRDISGDIIKIALFQSANENELGSGRRLVDEFDLKDCEQRIEQNDIQRYVGRNNKLCGVVRTAENEINRRLKANIKETQARIGDKSYAIIQSSLESGALECTDVNSINDCRLLFGACDPVMCPKSRFDLNGRWSNIDNVISSGISGSIVLGLHNYDPPYEVLPVCVTGIRAGLKNIQSIFKGYNDCLQLKKRTGESIGGCSYIRSLGWCKVVWGEATSIIGTIGPERIFQLGARAIGQGGNEYVTNFHENLKRSNEFANFFVNEYGQSVFAAYRGKGTKEIGSEFCEAAIFGRLPGQGSLVDQLLRPSVPAQFFAIFDESPHVAIDREEKSNYRILYHIYSGEDHDIRYLISLRNDRGQERQVTYSTLLEKGNTHQRTVNVIEDSGFNEICVRIDGVQKCGFGKVGSEFAISYAQEKLLESEYDRVATNENECLPEKKRLIDNPGIVTTPLSLIADGVRETGVKRTCSPENPGKGTPKEQGWLERGTCGKDKEGRDLGKCWLDKSTVNFQDELNIQKLKEEVGKVLEDLKDDEEIKPSLISLNDKKTLLDKSFELQRKKIPASELIVLKSNLEELENSYLELADEYKRLNDQTITPNLNGNIYFKLGELYQSLGSVKSTIENLEKIKTEKKVTIQGKCVYDNNEKLYRCSNVNNNEFVNLPGTQISIKIYLKANSDFVEMEFYNPKRKWCYVLEHNVRFIKDTDLNTKKNCGNFVSVKYTYRDDEFTKISFNVKLLQEATKVSPIVTQFGVPSSNAIESVKKHRKIINLAAENANVNPSLITAIISWESQGDELAVSECGAAGISQFLNGTAKQYGLKVPDYQNEERVCNGEKKSVPVCNNYNKQACDLKNDERFNAELSINAMGYFIKDLKKDSTTQGREYYIIAAYNGGTCNSNNNGALCNSRDCPGLKYFECTKNEGYEQTRTYVAQVLAYKNYYDLHPEIFSEGLIASDNIENELLVELPPEIAVEDVT